MGPTGPRDACWPRDQIRVQEMGGVLRTPVLRWAPAHPVPPRHSQQPAHCPEPSVLMALPPARRTQVLSSEALALVLHTKPLQKPRRAEGAQVLSSAGGSSWGPCFPLQAPLRSLQGTPPLVLCALPRRAWAGPLPGLCPACCPGHACCPSPPCKLPLLLPALEAVLLTAGPAQPPSG